MKNEKDDIWDKTTKHNILFSIQNNLYLYLFKEAQKNLEYGIEGLFNLNENDINILKQIHFLLSPQVKKLIKLLPHLIRNLSHSTNIEKIESTGIIQGQINWNKTYNKRYQMGYDNKSLFICNSTHKQYNLVENQVLKYILNIIIQIIQSLDIKGLEENFDKKETKYWQDEIIGIYKIVKNTRKNIKFQDITIPKHIKPKMLQKTYNNRNILYKDVVKCYQLYDSIFIENNQEELIDLVKHQILEPMNNDKLYEIYIFFKLIEPLDKNYLKLGLLRPNNDYTARYKTDNKIINIYYQIKPEIFKNKSNYKQLTNFYNFKFFSKRPDIIIEYIINNKKSYKILEIKRTKDPSYIVTSIYKILSYIKDYEKIELNNPNILIVWDGIEIINDEAYNKELTIMNNKEFLKNRDKILMLN